MGIRIDPALEFVWRDPHTVQLGIDPVRAVVPVPTLGHERFLGVLRSETPRDALPTIAEQVRCSPERAAAVLGAASPAMIEVVPPAVRRIEVLGTSGAAGVMSELLEDSGAVVVRTHAPRGGPVPAPDPPPTVAVVVAEHVIDPAVRAAWSRRPVPHLPVVIGDGRIRIGPLVEPGAGPCLSCIELARVDEDPYWPTIASQVWGRPVAPMSRLVTATVAALACGIVLARSATGRSAPDADQLVVDRDELSVSRRPVLPHSACACRALPGTDSADAHPTGYSPAATTTPSRIDELV